MAKPSHTLYAICHPRKIERTGFLLADAILSRRESIGSVLNRVNTVGAIDIKYTRTSALVARKMISELQRVDLDLYSFVKGEVEDMAVATFVEFWRGNGEPNSQVDPKAVTAYIGDLYAMGFLPYDMLTTCIMFLLNNVDTPFHFHCVRILLERASSYHAPRLSPGFLLDCLGTVRRRGTEYVDLICQEEELLIDDIYQLLFNYHAKDQKYHNRWNRRLSSSVINYLVMPTASSQDDAASDFPWLSPTASLVDSALCSVSSLETVSLDDWYEYELIYASPDPEDLPDVRYLL
ncbi:hypothetical protein B0H34DRAFT_798004 [Crassisporium funariophilum]|nr:hypothetical protein B0H34DRAFT_798004 [Crassisporium funariophilum]